MSATLGDTRVFEDAITRLNGRATVTVKSGDRPVPLEDYRVEHEPVRLDPEARNVRHTHVDPSHEARTWRVQQVLVDPALHNDWLAEFEVDLPASREANQPVR